MEMTIDELIEEEQDLVNIHQNIIDHCCEVTEDMSLEEMELADERQSKNQGYVNYHNHIIDILRKYQKVVQVLSDWKAMGYNENDGLYSLLSEVVEDGNVD